MPAKKAKASCSEPTNKTTVRGLQKTLHGTSCSSCCHTTSSASLQNLSADSLTSLPLVAQESRSSSTVHSPLVQTATHLLVQSRACQVCGRHVQLWPACHKVAALACHLLTGWCTAIREQTFGVWTLLVTAISQRLHTPIAKYEKTIRVASASPSRTKSFQQHVRCSPLLSMTV